MQKHNWLTRRLVSQILSHFTEVVSLIVFGNLGGHKKTLFIFNKKKINKVLLLHFCEKLITVDNPLK